MKGYIGRLVYLLVYVRILRTPAGMSVRIKHFYIFINICMFNEVLLCNGVCIKTAE